MSDAVYDPLTTERLRLLAEDRQDRLNALRRDLAALEAAMRGQEAFDLGAEHSSWHWADRIATIVKAHDGTA